MRRFLFKSEARKNLINCQITTLVDPHGYCNFVGTLNIRKHSDVYLLYKDVEHFYLLVPLFTPENVLLVNIGYVKKSEKEKIRKVLRQFLEMHDILNLKGYLLPVKGMKIPLIRNDLSNLEFYSINLKEFEPAFELPMLRYILYSTSNDFLMYYPELILPPERPQVKVKMHFWYALMWYTIACIGLIYYLLNSRKREAT